MKIASFLLLLAGWFLVLAAIVMLPTPGTRGGFIFSGLAVEALGLALAVRSHSAIRGAKG
jgi:Putative transmembrane protein (PGPGW)